MPHTTAQRLWGWTGTAILAGAGLALPIRAQDSDDERRGVGRISIVQGEVSIDRGDSGDWVAAAVNAPVMTGERIATNANSRAEIQFDNATFLRLAGNAEIFITDLEYARTQLGLARGSITFRVLRSSNSDLEVDTPSISVRPSKIGSYRITVTDAGETEVTARGGEVEVFSPGGSQWVRSGETLRARGSASDPEFQIVRAGSSDEWDRWNEARDQALVRTSSAQYVGPGIYGIEDLDPYGAWVYAPSYGHVWRPVVAAGWAPYQQGRWVWADWYGWTWVSDEPWGWAPYHYGRWFYEPAYGWCWYPGAVRVRHYWSPALVAFFGFGGGGVAVGFGNVGWVPLAPYEVFHPWWGRGYYGGPAYINRSINITNVSITNIYQNSRVANGVTAVRKGDFGAGRFHNFVRVSGDDLRSAAVARGPIPIAPDRPHLQVSDRQAGFVPRGGGNTRFFTREQPNPAPRVSFAEQRRAFDQPGRTPDPGGVNRVQRPNAGPVPPTRGWTRFGEPSPPPAGPARGSLTFSGGASTRYQPENRTRSERQSDPNATNRPAQPPARTQQAPAPRGTRFGQPGRSEEPRFSPPVMRERPSGARGESGSSNTGLGGRGGRGGNSPRGGSRPR